MATSRSVAVVSMDESVQATVALKWAIDNLCLEKFHLHIVTVLPPITYSVYPVAPVATAAAVSSVTQQWEAQRRQDETAAKNLLKIAEDFCVACAVQKSAFELHTLPASGGASGVAESLVEYTKLRKAELLIVGSRGLGSLQRSLMSFVGLGSVSDYCTHNAACPVVVVRSNVKEVPHVPANPEKGRVVCIAADESVHSDAAVHWALQRLVRPQYDTLHLITCAASLAYPLLDETSAAVAAVEAQQWHQRNEQAMVAANKLCERLRAVAAEHGLPAERVVVVSLKPDGGASDAGAALCKYATVHNVELLALGSRGLGSLQRSFMGFMGLGSVSDYCVHNLHCAVVVIKSDKHGHVQPEHLDTEPVPVPARVTAPQTTDKTE